MRCIDLDLPYSIFQLILQFCYTGSIDGSILNPDVSTRIYKIYLFLSISISTSININIFHNSIVVSPRFISIHLYPDDGSPLILLRAIWNEPIDLLLGTISRNKCPDYRKCLQDRKVSISYQIRRSTIDSSEITLCYLIITSSSSSSPIIIKAG